MYADIESCSYPGQSFVSQSPSLYMYQKKKMSLRFCEILISLSLRDIHYILTHKPSPGPYQQSTEFHSFILKILIHPKSAIIPSGSSQ